MMDMTTPTAKTLDSVARKVYYDASHPAGFGGQEKLLKYVREEIPTTKKEDIQKWMSAQDTYTLNKSVRRRFARNKMWVYGIDSQWQADLVDLSSLAKFNRGYKYILTVIDVFSKYSWVKPLKTKSGPEIRKALVAIFKEGRIPNKLQTDKGSEFYNKHVKKALTDHGVHLFSTFNETKAAVVERFNRPLKEKMWKMFYKSNSLHWLTSLQDFVNAYNESVHSTISMKPKDVNVYNELAVYDRAFSMQRTKHREPKFRKGDNVRISMTTQPFRKGYLPKWQDEIFVVHDVIETDRRPLYKLKDLNGEMIEGRFYHEELQNIASKDSEEFYRVEKIIKKRKRNGKMEYFVKWQGYPDTFNSWTSDIHDV